MTEKFWAAVETGDVARVRKFVVKNDAAELALQKDILPISAATLGRTIIDKEVATVDTTVTISGDNPVTFPLTTHLLLEEGEWKVDYKATTATVSSASQLARVMEHLREFGSALQHGIESSVDELEATLPDIEQEIGRIEEQVKQKVPELRQRIETFAKDLEKAFKNPPPDDAPEPSEPIAI